MQLKYIETHRLILELNIINKLIKELNNKGLNYLTGIIEDEDVKKIKELKTQKRKIKEVLKKRKEYIKNEKTNHSNL